jgi:hypothetical protein
MYAIDTLPTKTKFKNTVKRWMKSSDLPAVLNKILKPLKFFPMGQTP